MRVLRNGQSDDYVIVEPTRQLVWVSGKAWWREECGGCAASIDEQVVETGLSASPRLQVVH